MAQADKGFICAKIFNDSIHGHIELHPACTAIIDTPQFQRLRFIKQLGLCYFLYPGGCHNRFEHSIGVCFLAGELVRNFQRRQPELNIDDKDVLCVEIAGLCHDLGHGPFSHMFDSKFIPTVAPNMSWKHEMGSLMMLDYLIQCNGLMESGERGVLRKYGLTETDILFIKELIDRPCNNSSPTWQYKGRPKEKGFLYEVVSNKRNGIDVDKWDYFSRDCHHLGITNRFDYNRFIKFARVLKESGVNGTGDEWQICVRDKELGNLFHMFYTRYMLHKVAYQHKVNCAVEEMMLEAMVKANDHIKIGKNRKKISECVTSMEDFLYLNDNILFKILESDDENLKESREIIERILHRDLYKCIIASPSMSSWNNDALKNENKILNDVLNILHAAGHTDITKEHFLISIAKWDFGMGEQNPLEKIRVYSKTSPNVAREPSNEDNGYVTLQPTCFKEIQIRVYSRTKVGNICDKIVEAFKEWMKENNVSASLLK